MIVDCAAYTKGIRREGRLDVAQALAAAHEPDTFSWIGLYEPTEDEFAAVRREFSLHELAVEDAIKAHQRPKLEVFGDSLFIVLKTARYVDSEEVVEFGEILLFVGTNFLVSVRHGKGSPLDGVRQKAEMRPDLLRHGPAAVLYAILDRVVDDYRPVCEGVERDIEEVEGQVFLRHSPDTAERIYYLKREVLDFQHASHPLVLPLTRLTSGELSPIVPREIRTFFQDVYDHLLRIVEQVDRLRDALNSILQANLAQVTVRQNEDMRKISAWVAILAVPTMIAGVYGMNFKYMPEIQWRGGYPFALLLMGGICTWLYLVFRRTGWL